MLLLTSTSDKLQVISSAPGSPTTVSLAVHASYVDNAAGTITPDRKNTSITTEATTDVVAAPAASTQRNVQTLTIRNRNVADSVTVTVQHTDGTTVAELFKMLLLAGETLMFIEGSGFFVIDSNGQVKTGTGFNSVNMQNFTASGTYTPSAGMKWCIAIVTGAGGGGGGSDSAGASGDVGVGGGGGAGETRIGFFSKAQVGASQTVTINAAGTPGSATNGTNGGTGGNAVFGTLITAIGGGGGTGSTANATDSQSSAGGASGTGGTGGTVAINGGQGASGIAFSVDGTTDTSSGIGGDGGASMWGGGGRGGNTASTTLTNAANVAGQDGQASGSGGGGAVTTNSTTGAAGGTGGGGRIVVIEFS